MREGVKLTAVMLSKSSEGYRRWRGFPLSKNIVKDLLPFLKMIYFSELSLEFNSGEIIFAR
jgi:hypothetical protein